MNRLAKTLPETLENNIRTLYNQGYDHYDKCHFKQALRTLYKGWVLIPQPQIEHEISGWILTAIGDCYYRMMNYKSGLEALRSAIHCPNTMQHAFVHLRLGQCLYELGQREDSYQEFKMAIKFGDTGVFNGQTAKYVNFYKTRAFSKQPLKAKSSQSTV